MKKVFILAAAAFAFVACGTKTQKQEIVEKYDVAKVFEQADQLVGKTIAVEGTVAHVCGHGGNKMFLVGEDQEKRLKVEPAGELESFSPEMEGAKYVATGVLEEMRIDEEYLNKWESEINAEGEQEGHDHTAAGEKADQGEHTSALEKIKTYREQLAATEKGYLSFYTLKATKIEKVEEEADSTEEAKEQEQAEETQSEGSETAQN